MDMPQHPRRTVRLPLDLAARCRTQGGLRDVGSLADISTHGCCITTASLYLHVGMRITIKPQGLEGITGIVRWLSGSRAGVEFDRPLYAPVVQHLFDQCSPEFPVDVEHAGEKPA